MPITGAPTFHREAIRRRRSARCCSALLGAALPFLGVPLTAQCAAAQDLALHADLGIGGKYRAGSWIPITVTVLNQGNQNYHGQIQVLSDQFGAQNHGQISSLPTEIFAVPATIPPSQGVPQRFTLYARDLDPTRDNFTVQFANGDQGEGRVEAKIVTTASYHVRPFSGQAIPAGDLLVVGVGSDPIGVSFLSGRKLGLRHTPAGIQPELKQTQVKVYGGPSAATPLSPPTVQAATTQPSDLPDSAAGYRGVDAVLLGADAALDSLSDAQIQALQLWTLSGGRLVVYGGAGSGSALPAALQQFLPARFTGTGVPISLPTGKSIGARLIPASANGATVRQKAEDGSPLMISARYGAGSVLMLAYDPTAAPFHQWAGPQALGFWRSIVTGEPALLPYAMQREERGASRFYGFEERNRISDIVLHVPQLKAPDVLSVAIFLGLYIIILVPVNYFILKKLDRREWAWITIPGIVLLVSAGAYGVGYASKGNSRFVNRATILETSAGRSLAAAYSGCGLFSSQRANYDIDLSNPTAIAADPGPIRTFNRSWGGADAANFGGVHYVATNAGTALRGAGINMWSMRTFDVQAAVDMGGVVDGSLRVDGKARDLLGSITNHTAYALQNCSLYWDGGWLSVGNLASGASFTIRASQRQLTGGFDILPPYQASRMSLPSRPADHPSSVDGMGGALSNMTQSIGRENNQNNDFYGVNPEGVRKPFRPGADDAVLIGWNTDSRLAGPPLKIDGQTTTQDDVTLVVVHIPVQ